MVTGRSPTMDLSTPTEELTIADTPESASPQRTELHPLLGAAVRQGCAACGASMAADQRYCVECGERRGAPRVSLLEGPAHRPRESPPQSAPARRRIAPVNSTLISIIGILLLAMGIGVLIGRSGNTTVKSPPAQVVTVSGGPSTGAAATTPTTSTGTTAAAESSSAAAKAKSKASAKTTPTTSKVPLPKAVKVGSAGHGRGYQNGHFTGNFFGE
jgi:hypothetical protein